jgi:endonuclease III-like uncharacterized protein
MRDIQSIVKEVVDIYRENGNDAEEYLRKARKLQDNFGPGPAIVYCWFYSVPQKWTQVEPKILEFMKRTDYFDLDTILAIPIESLAMMLKPMIFHNSIALQLKRFCQAIKGEYGSWDAFSKVLSQESIFTLFNALSRLKGIRLTFKNLAAMKIFVGMSDNLIILDTHVAKVLGISKHEASKCRVQDSLFKNLLEKSEEITWQLRSRGLYGVSMALWSLAIWFSGAKIQVNRLLSSH